MPRVLEEGIHAVAPPRKWRVDLVLQRLGLVAVIVAVWWIVSLGLPHFIMPGPPRVMQALAMISAWGLSEVFSRRMRLALPSIALAVMFAGGAAFAAATLGSLASTGLTEVFAGIAAAFAAVAHERRFRVPVDWAIAAFSATYAIAYAVWHVFPAFNSALLFAVLGGLIFAAALRVDASDRAGDRSWPMPTFEDYFEQLKSEIADFTNTGGRPGGAITGALFIKEFSGGLPWTHIDIAGTAWAEDAKPHQPKGPTGVAVRTLVELAMAAEAWGKV